MEQNYNPLQPSHMQVSAVEEAVNEVSQFGLKDIVDMVLKKWYWFAISIILCLGISVLYVMRTSPVYTRTATILVKDSRKGGGASELAAFGDLAGLNTRRNVDNELFVLQARRLMVEVVDKLGLTVNYTTRSGLRTVDLYRRSPIEVQFINDANSGSCMFTVLLDENDVTISEFVRSRPDGTDDSDEDEDFCVKSPYGETIVTPYGEIVVNKTLYMEENYLGKEICVSKRPRELVATAYRSAMHSSVANKMSSIINISLNDIVPRRAEDIINTLIEVYNNDAINDKQQIAEATADFIDVRLAIISKELGSVDSDIQTFKTRNSMVDIETETTKNITESSKLKTEVLSLESQIEMSKFVKDYLLDAGKDYALIPITDLSRGQSNALSKQIADYNELLLRREKFLLNSSLNNPVIQQLDRDRAALKNAILASLESNIATLDIQLKNLRREQSKTDARISSVPLQEQEYLSIARQQRIKEELYLYLLNKREENAISLAITENTARIVDSAFGPQRPIAPRKSFILLIALVLGCAVPFVILYLRELLDTTVRSKHDITKYTNVPYLGDVPIYSGPRTARGVVVRANGRDKVSEAFRIIRTNMAFMNTGGQDSQVLLVTSSNQHAGKTFVSTNLAMTLAMSGNKVLLIDLDLRRRTMSKHMGQRNNPVGISRYMSDKSVQVADIISRSELHENFDCIYAGLQPPNPAEQLMSSRLDELIAECRKLYDYVVIDSVPALVIADAIIASRVADLTLYIVREGLLDRRQLPDIDSLYKQDKLKNMCILLNGSSDRNHRYGYTYDDESAIIYTRFEKVLCKMGFSKLVRKFKKME